MNIKNVSPKLWSTVLCLLVVVSLFTAEFSWLAQPVHAETCAWPCNNPSRLRLSARIVGHRLQISGAGFPQQHVLLVRARLNNGSAWYSLNWVRASRRGGFFADLPLPHRLENANNIRACVKDTISGRLNCVTAHRY